jgi:Ubiquitin interaction motif.
MEDAPAETEHVASVANAAEDIGDEDAMLQQALAMSMADAQVQEEEQIMTSTSSATNQASMPQKQDNHESNEYDDDGDDDAAMQMALAMSMADNHDSTAEQGLQRFQDPEFVNQLLGSLPGVDPNDSSIQKALENLEKANQQDKNKEEDKNDEKDDNDDDNGKK